MLLKTSVLLGVVFGLASSTHAAILRDVPATVPLSGADWRDSYFYELGSSYTCTVAISAPASGPVTLTLFKGYIGSIGPSGTPFGTPANVAVFEYYFQAWGSVAEASASPRHGTKVDLSRVHISSGPTPYGTDVLGAPTNSVEFDLSASNISIPAGETWLIGIEANTAPGIEGRVGWLRPSTVGPDIQVGTRFPNNIFEAGTFAIGVEGFIVPEPSSALTVVLLPVTVLLRRRRTT